MSPIENSRIEIIIDFLKNQVKKKDEQIKLRKITPCEIGAFIIGSGVLFTSPYFFIQQNNLVGGALVFAGSFINILGAKHTATRHIRARHIQKAIKKDEQSIREINAIVETCLSVSKNVNFSIEMNNLDSLPPYLISVILDKLNQEEVLTISTVSKNIYKLSCDLQLWKDLIVLDKITTNFLGTNNKINYLQYKKSEIETELTLKKIERLKIIQRII